jgi:hypothetical protein
MSIPTVATGWWAGIREMAERRRKTEGKTGGVLVVGESAFAAILEAVPSWAPSWDGAQPLIVGRCRFDEVLLSLQFLPWQALIMDDGDLVPDQWFEDGAVGA